MNKKHLLIASILFLFVSTVVSISLIKYQTKVASFAQVKSAEKNVKDVQAEAKSLTNELLKLDPQSSITQDKAKQRKAIMEQLIMENPKEALKLSLGGKARNQFPQAKKYLEEDVTLEGTLDVLHADDFQKNIAKYFYYLTTKDKKKYSLYLTKKLEYLRSGTRVKVKGLKVDDLVAINNEEPSSFEVVSTPSVEGISTPVVKNIAYVLVSFQNSTSYRFTPDFMRGVAFTDQNSVNAYFHEASFGAWSMEGDVFGWYTIPYQITNPEVPDSADCAQKYQEWTTAAEQAAAAQGVNLASYEKVVYAFNLKYTGVSCPGSGWTFLGGNKSWVVGDGWPDNIAHELGHTFELSHAHNRTCYSSDNQKVPISQNCTNREYGDPYDVMGVSGKYHHFNNFHKGTLGFYEDSNTHTVTSSGSYAILPIESNTTQVQSLRIPLDPNSTSQYKKLYYIEFRQPYGFFDNFPAGDPVTAGVSVRIGTEYLIDGSDIFGSYLLDMTPADNIFTDSTLKVGQTFSDPASGISITTDSISPQVAQVSIIRGTPQCVRGKPAFSISPLNSQANPGEAKQYVINFTNQDSFACLPTTFTINPSIPSGWNQNPQPLYTLALGPDTFTQVGFTLTSPIGATPGVYSFMESVVHPADATLIASASANYTVVGLVPPTPTATPTPTPTIIPPTPTPESDIIPPTVSITNPVNNSVVAKNSTVTISANATDNKAVSKVEFYVGTSLICNDISVPYNCSWRVPAKPKVQYNLSAKAFDAAGNSATSTVAVTSK